MRGAVQCTVQCSAVQCSAGQCKVQCSAVQCSAMRGAVQSSAVMLVTALLGLGALTLTQAETSMGDQNR